MATTASRGTKRTCQNSECGARFYDLKRNPITCPICQSAYVIASSPAGLAAAPAAEQRAARKLRRPEIVDPGPPAHVPEVAAEEALVDGEVAEAPIAADEDETFLEEEEEEGGDVSNIIGGPVAEGEET